ncbi:MAG: 2-oxo acid dehydrogenase subunit E2 [Anaerolineales bacterium]|nr:2-oxo acid dehydrogenase subunit E2 [Anaerolineales bacterium]
MPTQVIMPQLGESIVEGTIGKWLKQEGEAVTELEALLEVNTDKVDTEIPAPASGVLLKVLAAEGAVVKVGTPIAVIGEPGAAVDLPPAAKTNGHHAEEKAELIQRTQTGRQRDLGFISPVVAKLADEFKVDLYQIQGSGLSGRITKKDVLNYIEAQKTAPAPKIETPPPTPDVHGGTARPVISEPLPVSSPPPAVTRAPSPVTSSDDAFIRVDGMRKLIAEHMVRSKNTAPHVTTVFEADMSRVIAHQQKHAEAFARDGAKLTLTAYFISAIVAGLKAVPVVNSQWGEDKIWLKRELNIGMAVALEDGLIVPVIKRADEKSLLGLAREINELAKRARAKSLKAEEVQGGTFTLTNHGVSGSLFATPVINQPQTAILGAGAVQKRVVVLENDAIAVRAMAYLSLTFDHRVLDGAVADRFMQVVKAALENWA